MTKEASLMHQENPKFEYSQITDNIYIGTNQCCQTHFEEELLDKGITADISLEGEMIDRPAGVDYFVWLPTVDHTPPTMKQLKIGVANLKEIIDLDIKVYVHCQRGHGRAPTLVAAYFISQGKEVEAAIEAIRAKRPSIHLEDSQIEILREYRQELAG
jgi:hypothetical protein